MRHHLSLATILLLSTALPVLSAPKWQEYGVTTEGKSMSLDSSSPKRNRGGNTITFKYRVTDRDGKENIRTATSEDCFVGNSRTLNGRPSRWNVKLEDVWMPVTADSEASKNMLINACRIANGGKLEPIASKPRSQQSHSTLLDSTGAYSNSGNNKIRLGNFQGAISDYTQAIKFNPNNEVAYLNRAIARSKAGDVRGAIYDCNQAISINSNYE